MGPTKDFKADSELVEWILDSLPAQVAVIDASGAIRGTNRQWQSVAESGGLGAPQSSNTWNYFDECLASEARGCREAPVVFEGAKRVISGEAESFVTTYPCPINLENRWFQVTVAPTTLSGDRAAIMMHVDVSALQHDPLTGLANRAVFDMHMGQLINLAKRDNLLAAVVMIDLDHFKTLNDTYGHSAGDEVLIQMARRMERVVRQTDLVARMGGDEFAIALAPSKDGEAFLAVAERVLSAIKEPREIEGHELVIEGSAGVALYPDNGTTVTSLVGAADAALYRVKQSVRGHVRLAMED